MSAYTIEEEIEFYQGIRINEKLDTIIKVEGQDDEPFWKSIFYECFPELKIEIYKESVYFPSVGASGKGTLLHFASYSSKELILCLDSDYDFLLDNEVINSNPFVLQTYADSIENYWCNPKHLQQICCKAGAVDVVDFDFESFFEKFSEIVYELFLVSVHEESKKQDNTFDRKALGVFMSLEGTKDVSDNGEEILNVLAQKVEGELTNHQLSEELKSRILSKLEILGINRDNISWLIRGKNIYSITQLLVKSVVNNTVAKQKQKIANQYAGNEIQQQIENYHSTRQRWEELLLTEYKVKDSPFFNKIQNDINAIFN